MIVASLIEKLLGGLGLLGFAAFAVLLTKVGLTVARREDRRKLELKQAAEERDRLAEVVPDFLREPLISTGHLVLLVSLAAGTGTLGALLAGLTGAAVGLGAMLVPGWLYLERDRRAMRRSAIERGRELRTTMPAAQHEALMQGLFAMYAPERLKQPH